MTGVQTCALPISRIFRMLLRAGFSSAAIFKVLKRWNVDDQVLAAVESEAEQVESE